MAYNILIVDDSSVMRSMILKTMRLSGLPIGEVYEGAHGKEGLEALNNHWIDIVLVDINMPVMNGEEMIDNMHQNTDLKDIPIIVISTEGSSTRINRIQYKVSGFIRKPFAPETIRDMVFEVMNTTEKNKGEDSDGS